MEKKIESTIVYWGYVRFRIRVLGFPGFGVLGFQGLGPYGLNFRVLGLGVWDLGLKVWGLRV